MKNVQNLQAALVAIYPAASFPVIRVAAGSRVEKLRDTFAFGAAEVTPAGEAIFQRGRLLTDGDEIIIQNLQFDDRRVVVGVAGSSEQSDRVLEALEGILFAGSERLAPLLVVYEASCTAELDFDWQCLFNEKIVSFIEDDVRSSASVLGIKPRIPIAGLAISMAYETPSDLSEYSITLSPKSLSIGLAPKSPPAKRKFLFTSPSRTEEHLRLLETLEKTLTVKPKKVRSK